jgi:molybdopterin-binding protein
MLGTPHRLSGLRHKKSLRQACAEITPCILVDIAQHAAWLVRKRGRTEDEDFCSQRARRQDRQYQESATTAHVEIDVAGTIVTASITNESVDNLNLKVGDSVHAIIKASDVMVAIPD